MNLREAVVGVRGWVLNFAHVVQGKGFGAGAQQERRLKLFLRGAHAYRCTWVITIPYHFYDRLDLQFHSKMLREMQNFYDLLPYLQPPQLYKGKSRKEKEREILK